MSSLEAQPHERQRRSKRLYWHSQEYLGPHSVRPKYPQNSLYSGLDAVVLTGYDATSRMPHVPSLASALEASLK